MRGNQILLYRWNVLTGRFDIPVTIGEIAARRGRKKSVHALVHGSPASGPKQAIGYVPPEGDDPET